MANKTKTVKGNSPALGVKMAASAAIMLATTKATTNEEEDLKAMVARLKSELDNERRTNRQLRREKEAEVLKVRNEEQTKSSIALKDLSKRLLEEKQRELELQRESMRNKLDSDLGKIVKLKQRDVAKLRGDLARCQDQLKEELSNRGLSTSARATFDSERHKLLQEVRDLQTAKRQLEDRLTEAGETEKRLQLEIRRLQESCKLEVARVEREANVEVKKLLDELKTKDHMLEQMDRQIYPDRSTVLRSIMDKLSVEEILNRQTKKWISSNTGATRSSSCSGRISSNSDESINSNCESSCDNSCSISSFFSCTCENKNGCMCNNDKNSGSSCTCENTNSCSCNNTSNNDKRNCSSPMLYEDTSKYTFNGNNNIVNDKSSDNLIENSSNCTCNSSQNNSLCEDSDTYMDKSNNSSCSNRSCKRSSSAGSRNIGVSKACKTRNGRRCRSTSGQHGKTNQNTNSSSSSLASDRGDSISNCCDNNDSSKSKDTIISSHMPTTATICATSGGCGLQTVNLQKKLYETEKKVKLVEGLHRTVVERNKTLSTGSKQLENKIKSLNTQLHNMRNEQESNRKEIKRLNDKIVSVKSNEACDSSSDAEFYKLRCAELDQVLVSLRRDCQEKDRRIGLLIKSQQKRKHKYEPKTVRFLLPDETDEAASDITEEGSSSLSSSFSDPVQDDELLIQSMHKDYESLMEEHLKLEKYCASLMQSQSTNHNVVNQELHIKRESLDVAIQAMQEKLRLAEEREQRLKLHVQEICDQNEELEFRILELEEGSERNMSASYTENEEDVIIRNRQLEEEVVKLRLRLSQYECPNLMELEKDASSPLPAAGATGTPDPQRLSMENLRKLTASLSDSDEDNQMVQSFSTMTSGFDEISCISLELDDRTEMPDMPVEEEADLEKDADDIGPEMPTEECDDFTHLEGLGEVAGENLMQKHLSGTEECSEILERSIELSTDNPKADLPLNQLFSLTAIEPELTEVSSDIGTKASDVESISERENSVQDSKYRDSFQTTKEDAICSISGACDCSVQRIRDLQDQVQILERVDGKYSATIETLNEIENRLIAVIPTGVIESQNISEERNDSPNSAETFWTSTSKEIESTIATAEREMKELGHVFEREEGKEISEDESETVLVIEHCINTLQETGKVLQVENKVCQELDRRIKELEQQQSSEYSSDFLDHDSLFQNSSEFVPIQPKPLYPRESTDYSVVGALKRLALDVVTAGFKTDFLELKSLTHDFFSASVEDELNDIAFIDEDDVACVPSDSSSTTELEGPSRLQMRNELRLNTKMSSINQRFDFLSPTSFDNPEWNDSSHLEAVNHCLFQQIEDLERERDSLKDIVYRDDSVINDMTQQISRLENSEQELKKIVSRLELADDQAGELIGRLESQCQEFRVKLSRAESIENSLRAELDSRGKSEAKMEEKLLRSVESLEQTTAKLRGNLQEMERAKMDAEKHSEELNCLVNSLQSKETTNLQRIKSLESLRDDLKQKANDLEVSLNSAYDEVSGLTRQKDGLAQRLNSLVDENQDLRIENDELIVEKKNLAAEVDRLGESENFLKEANRKMWLSLQANIEEREANLSETCAYCKKNHINSAEIGVQSVNLEQTIKKNEFMRDSCAQTDKALYCHLSKSKNATATHGLNDFLALLILLNPRSIVRFKNSDRSKGSLVTERKARLEEMLKFVSSRKIRLAANEMQLTAANTNQDAKTTDDNLEPSDGDISDLDPVEGEEEFWSVVEKYEDILDVRAADTWNMWRHLEQDIMGLNLEQLKKLLEESEKLQEKSCQTIESSQQSVHSTNKHTQYEPTATAVKFEKETEKEKNIKELELPPLPATLPPKEGQIPAEQRDYSVISCSECFTQTDLDDLSPQGGVKSEDLITLRHLLNQNERTLNAQKHEVDRLTVEMRSWQQRALAATEQVDRLTTELSTAHQHSLPEHISSIIDSKTPPVTRPDRRSRIELPTSQIPVSVKRAVDFYSSISLRSGSTSPSPVSPRTSSLIPRLVPGATARPEGLIPTTQGPLSNGSSFSQSSQIPRLLPDWIQQQQLTYQGQQQQQGDSGTRDDAADDENQLTADSSSRLQQLPAAAATTSSYTAAENETEVPRLPFRDERGEGS